MILRIVTEIHGATLPSRFGRGPGTPRSFNSLHNAYSESPSRTRFTISRTIGAVSGSGTRSKDSPVTGSRTIM